MSDAAAPVPALRLRRRRGRRSTTSPSRRSAARPTSTTCRPTPRRVAVRMIHGTGQVDLDRRPRHPPRAGRARPAPRCEAGAPILTDAHMVASGVTRARLPRDNEVLCAAARPRVRPTSRCDGAPPAPPPRVSLWEPRSTVPSSRSATPRPRCSTCSRCCSTARPRPAAIVGCPVGFIGAAESKQALDDLRAEHGIDVPFLTVRGRRGGSAMTASALNALAQERGVRPPPALLRRRPRSRRPRADHPQGRAADRAPPTSIAFHAGVGKQSNARRIAADLIPAAAIEEELRYPVTTGADRPPGRLRRRDGGVLRGVAPRASPPTSTPGRDVVLLAEGDPLFYGSFMYMHDRLADALRDRGRARACRPSPPPPPPLASPARAADRRAHRAARHAARARARAPPRRHRRRDHHEARPHLPRRRRALAARPAASSTRCTSSAPRCPSERWLPVADVDPDSVPYFSLIVVPGDSRNGSRSREVAPLVEQREDSPLVEHRRCERLEPKAAAPPRPRPRPRPGRLAHPRGRRGPGDGRPRRRLRAVRRPRPPARGPDPALPPATPSRSTAPGSRSTSRVAGSGSRSCRAATPGVFGMAAAVFEAADDRRTPRCRSGSCPASAPCRPWRRGPAPRSAPTSRSSRSRDRLKPWAGRRAAAARDRRGRPGARDLQPRLALAHLAGRRRRRSSCWSTAAPTPWSSSAATSAAPRSR